MGPAAPTWPCKPRTRAKLEILGHYLGAWFSILANRQFPHVYYIDGFCGPGEYSTGEEGSPVIAARLASNAAQKYPGFKATLIFIDKNRDAIRHLSAITAIKNHHPNVAIDVKIGEFSDQVDDIINELQRNPNSPTFSFIDPFGFGKSPFDTFKQLMHNKRSELMVNFWCGYMNRFKEHPDPAVTEKIKNMVGLHDLQGIIDAPDSIDAFCDAFNQNLKSVGQYTLKFMMRDEGNIRDNAFFFCGRQTRGFEKIKEAMWKVDPVHGNAFSAHKEAKSKVPQSNLFEDAAYTHRLARLIAKHFQGCKDVPVEEIFNWVITDTDTFLKPHARIELEHLYERQFITSVKDPKSNTRKRAKHTWPSRLLLSFK